MILISCYCPEDKLQHVAWPSKLSVRPLLGEWIASLDNKHARQIVRIEHLSGRNGTESILGIELGRTKP